MKINQIKFIFYIPSNFKFLIYLPKPKTKRLEQSWILEWKQNELFSLLLFHIWWRSIFIIVIKLKPHKKEKKAIHQSGLYWLPNQGLACGLFEVFSTYHSFNASFCPHVVLHFFFSYQLIFLLEYRVAKHFNFDLLPMQKTRKQ